MIREVLSQVRGELRKTRVHVAIQRFDYVRNFLPRHWLVVGVRIGPNRGVGFGVKKFDLEGKAC
jgi:hypothetical protein